MRSPFSFRLTTVDPQEKIIAACDTVQRFCKLLNDRLKLIEKTREMPADMHEAISSLIFAASRMPEVCPQSDGRGASLAPTTLLFCSRSSGLGVVHVPSC